MKKRVRTRTAYQPEKSGGKRLLIQSVFCILVLVLVFAVQHTAWSGTVQTQISRLFGYEIDYVTLGQTIMEQLHFDPASTGEAETEPASTSPEPEATEPVLDEPEPPAPEPEDSGKWTLLNTGRITSRYGNRELDGVVGFHSGIDIAGNYGDAVYAIGDGVVRETGMDDGYGNYIKIWHEDRGVMTLYGHLQSIGVNQGQAVTRGATVGAVGSTGRSNGPHLHLEVRSDDNRTLDPEPYILY